jgi:hypothetical protein
VSNVDNRTPRIVRKSSCVQLGILVRHLIYGGLVAGEHSIIARDGEGVFTAQQMKAMGGGMSRPLSFRGRGSLIRIIYIMEPKHAAKSARNRCG